MSKEKKKEGQEIMRNIKFRAKDKFIKKFIYGDLLQIVGRIEICNKDGNYEIDSETVGQYTGVHDNNDSEVEIFENDKVVFTYDDNEYSGVIKFEAGAFIIACDELPDSYITMLDITQSDRDYYWIDGEVVGNIHELSEVEV